MRYSLIVLISLSLLFSFVLPAQTQQIAMQLHFAGVPFALGMVELAAFEGGSFVGVRD